MLNSKVPGSTPVQRRRGVPAESSTPVEPQSFAPRGRYAANDTASIATDPRKRALIVIPTLNEAPVVARVIARVLDDEGLVDPLVVVADGGSSDGTRDVVRAIAEADPRVRLINNPGRLQSAALNLAAATAGGDRAWLVRVDAHADYPKNYASSLIAEALRTGANSVVVSMLTLGVTPFQRGVAAAQNSRLGAGGSPHRLASAGRWVDHGHHALFSLAAFEATGGYDETFSHNEDAEFDLRLMRQGGRIWLTDRVRIVYHPRRTPGALWKQYFSYGRGRARTALKHYAPLKLRQALPLAVAPAVLGALASPLFWPLATPALAWALGGLGFGAALAVLKGDAAVLLAGPAAMVMHLAWSAGFWSQLLTHGRQRCVEKLLASPRHAVS
jgi:succinoglycan biosynthesis protein ExoA